MEERETKSAQWPAIEPVNLLDRAMADYMTRRVCAHRLADCECSAPEGTHSLDAILFFLGLGFDSRRR